jgi:hypothetical protein
VIRAIAIGVLIASTAFAEEIRSDTYDRRSNRTGYFIYNPSTGRIDSFTTRGERLGYGTVTTPQSGGTRIDTFMNSGVRTGNATIPTSPRR